ncbi:hypothetical protein IMG5_004040 [Ichthyophthirius multifiliis]|uniref:E3 ubiquitin ligase UBR4 C-terminal domain-containing protein n=1 Tax=Ichthyophthirius multifiliis TaxID=5932 RepID=G0QJC5_ICHMU|nr:hypothetical protein IMG5_004040 [Ichthyophthirius multifiliis]EGR34688.1 hypothetical protein IMG5_004040 [Ichthyophthirius multifiliis]|eukprot:XP_004039992.1 hypothetical protein IMG5_004040 [Ichthyophthirius multifiliis]
MIVENQALQEPKQWDQQTQNNLNRLFDEFFIDNLNENIRKSSLQLLCSLWVTGNYEQKKSFYDILYSKCDNLLNYGKNNEEFFQLFQFMCNKQNANQEFIQSIQDLFSKLLLVFSNALNQLSQHPDHQLYLFLEDIVDDYKTFKPSYFELNGCLVCYGQYQQNLTQSDKLGVVQQEIRPAQNRLIIKLKKTMEIQQIILPKDPSYIKNKKSFIKQINIYINNNLSSDMNSLKTDMNLWKKTKTVNITQDNKEQTAKDFQITFPIPITAKFICLEFILNGKLPPSCQRCPEVRGEGSGLFCNQCQWSPLISVENSHFIYKSNSFTEATIIDCDKSKENCEIAIQDNNKIIYDLSQELLKEKYKMKILYDRYYGSKCVNSSGILLNSDDLNILYQDLMSSMNALISYKKALAQYSGISTDNFKKQIFGNENKEGFRGCYGCLQQFIYIFLNFMGNKDILQCVQDDNLIKSLKITLEELFLKGESQFQAKIVHKSMNLHKKIFCVKLNQESLLYLNTFLEKTEDEFLHLKPSLNDQELNFYKIRLLDVKSFLQVLKDQMLEEENAKNKQLNSLRLKIINFVNNVMPSILQKAYEKNHSSGFQNQIIVPLLEIIQLEINKESPFIQNNAQNTLSSNSQFQFDKTLSNINQRNKDILLEQEKQIQEKLQKGQQFISQNFGQNSSFNRYNFMLSYSGLGALIGKDSQQRDSLSGIMQSQQQSQFKKNAKELIQQKQKQTYSQQKQVKSSTNNNTKLTSHKKKENLFTLLNIIIGLNQDFGELTEERCEVLSNQFQLRNDNWLQQCIKLFSSRRINEIMHFIIVQIAYFNKKIALNLLLNALPQALENQENSIKYFELFREVIKIQNLSNQQDQVIKKLPGLSMMHQQSSEESTLQKKELEEENLQEEHEYIFVLQNMFKLLDEKLQKYAKNESQQVIFAHEFVIQNLNMGQSLNQLAVLIKILIDNQKIKTIFKNNNKIFMQYIIQSVVNIRKFKFILNQNFFQIENILSTLFLELQSNNFMEKFKFLKSLIVALPSNSKNPLGQEFLMEQINKILIPKKLNINLRLEVQANQREYLPSSLPKKDIPANEFGNTMNDILSRIKSELPDSSWVIEMLVANKLIINKDLPIDLVYKKVWIPSQLKGIPAIQIDWKKQVQTSAMKIVYRITGFDGEAHEETVDQMVDEDLIKLLSFIQSAF